MFCHKCGAKTIEGAEFCQKCGAKLVVDIPVEQPVETPPNNQVQQSAADPRVDPVQQPALTKMNTSGKKKSKLPIIIGITGVVIVAAIVLVVLNWGGKADYEATVRAYTPYATSQGMPYTCGEVFDKYVPDADWKVRESGDVHYVDISGIAKGAEREITVTVQVEAEEDRAVMKPASVKLDGAELSENAFFALFVAYDEKDDDLSHLKDLISEVDFALRGGELSGVFSDEATGISFRYPDWWAALDTPSEYEIVDMISPRNSGNHITTFKVSMTFDVLDVFSGDETAVKNSLGDNCTLLNYGDIMLGDIPAKALTYQTKGLNGNDDIVVTFWYMIGEDVYRVACSYAEFTSAIYEPIFQAIMESYTIENAAGSYGGPVNSMEEAQRLVENWIVDHPMKEMTGVGNGAAANDVASISAEYFVFELWIEPREYAGLVYVRKSDGYMTFKQFDSEEGISLDEWYEEWYMKLYNGESTTNDAPSEYITFVYDGDEGSWITIYSDGTFTMQENVYTAYLTISGTYEESDLGLKFHIERSFSGFVGEDVEEFEMVFKESGMMEYRGDWIGSTVPGTIYILDQYYL